MGCIIDATLAAIRSAPPQPGKRMVPLLRCISPLGTEYRKKLTRRDDLAAARTEQGRKPVLPGRRNPKEIRPTSNQRYEGAIPTRCSKPDNLVHGVDGFGMTSVATDGEDLGLQLLIGWRLIFLQFGFAFKKARRTTNELATMGGRHPGF